VRLLLDSHVLLWYVLGDPKLCDSARDLIVDADNEILMSPATYWEIAIKVSIGKLALHGPVRGLHRAVPGPLRVPDLARRTGSHGPAGRPAVSTEPQGSV
jgi:hypothetical protein